MVARAPATAEVRKSLHETYRQLGAPELPDFRLHLLKLWGEDATPNMREIKMISRQDGWVAKWLAEQDEKSAKSEAIKSEAAKSTGDLRERSVDEVAKDIGVIGNKLIRKVTDYLSDVDPDKGFVIENPAQLDKAMTALEKAVKLKELLDGRPTERREDNRILENVPDEELFELFGSDYASSREDGRSLTPPDDYDPDNNATEAGGGSKKASVRH